MQKFMNWRYGFAMIAVTVFVLACSEETKHPLAPGGESEFAFRPRASLSAVFNKFQFLGFVLDNGGANDTPAQSDLNAFTRADNVKDTIGVKWVWDDVNSWTGSGQTGDACALFDTDNDGKANAAVCVRISNPGGDPNVVAQLSPGSPLNYTCGDSKQDRCASPVRSVAIDGIVCEVEKITGETFFTAGEDGADVLAACSIPLSAIGTSVTPNLINVCSFPSGSPNSNPFDCVITPGSGFLIIKKATVPDSSNQTFSFKVRPAALSDSSFSVKDSSYGVNQTAIIGVAPGTNYRVIEQTLPAGWSLDSASCHLDRLPPVPTGTSSGDSVSGITIASGETTICTFNNAILAPSISVVKTATPATIPETGDSVTFSVLVTNNSTIAVTLDSLVDDTYGDLDTQGTCVTGGSIAASGGTYSCSFKVLLAASEADSTHVNQVTAKASSAGGPATAQDTAVVTYSDVLPDISVTKTASLDTIFAAGGDSVDTFSEDQRFSRADSSGSNTTPVFNGDVCDDAGANDQPDQSDLNCFARADNVAGRLWVRWTWDDINSWTGTGQTGDACALLDTDNDGNANYAFCARIYNPGGDPSVIGQVDGSPILYKCTDNAPDRCTSKTHLENLDGSSVCTVSQVAEHFLGQGDDGFDIQALCNLKLTDLSPTATNANVDLLNVCSFPSGSPNSNAFDCVVSAAAGFLVIHKSTTPTNSDSYFGFTLRNSTNTANATATNGYDQWEVQGGAGSAAIPILPGTYALNEVMPANWKLGSILCTRNGSSIGTTDSAAATETSVTIVQGDVTDCTFTNVLSASASVTFTVTVTNNSAEAVTLYSLEDTENPTAGSPTYSTLNSVGTCATGGSIVYGTPYSCTFSRTVSGSPGTEHKDKVKAVGKDNETPANSDTKYSSIVTVTIQ